MLLWWLRCFTINIAYVIYNLFPQKSIIANENYPLRNEHATFPAGKKTRLFVTLIIATEVNVNLHGGKKFRMITTTTSNVRSQLQKHETQHTLPYSVINWRRNLLTIKNHRIVEFPSVFTFVMMMNDEYL